jgi:GT2 family glycosyltransferase
VILSYGLGGEYEALLGSLLDEGVAPAAILVVHNPAAPGEAPPGDLRGCELVVSPSNLGYAGGMNMGIERQLAAGCELLLLVTHDARLRPGSLAAMLDAAAANPGYAALGPVLLLTGINAPFSYGGFDSDDGDVHHLKTAALRTEAVLPCDWIDGGTMLLRAATLARVGGFDARFWGYAEDVELCLRLRRGGGQVGVVLGAVADQDPGGARRPGPWAYLRTRNGLAYALRAGGRPRLLRLAAKAAWGVAWELLRAAARGAGLRSGSPRGSFAVAVGTLRGLVDFARGRWGPPPSNLPGGSDVANTGPSG